MKRIILLFLAFAVVACNYRAAEEPVNTAEQIPPGNISIGGILAELKDSLVMQKKTLDDQVPLYVGQIKQLQHQVDEIKKQREKLDQGHFLREWNHLKEAILFNHERLTEADVNAWIALNDSLLKYTEQVRFADALEQMVYNRLGQQKFDEDQLKSFLYTRLYDRIYVNLYGSSSLQIGHTTGGNVRLVQNTNYLYDGKISIKLEMQDKRYLDLFVRIPEWAGKASVSVKGVKYNTIAGEFTEIAKKWKNGDEVEIIIGLRPVVVERKDAPKAFALTYGSLFLSHEETDHDSLVFPEDDPIKYLKYVSPPTKMPTFTFSGIPQETLVLQPYFADLEKGEERTAWIKIN